MTYQPKFDWTEPEDAHFTYEFEPTVALHLNVALATGRPLLVRGDPGTGKSSLAKAAAAVLGWNYLHHVVTSRTEADDLLFSFDAIARLAKAHGHSSRRTLDAQQFVTPGVLWWAFDPGSAIKLAARGKPPRNSVVRMGAPNSVVLIDEIDKADPNVPNDLLVPLGDFEFEVSMIDRAIKAPEGVRPLVILTSNGERALPRAFLRRCIVLRLKAPNHDMLERVTKMHFTADPERRDAVLGVVLGVWDDLCAKAKKDQLRAPSTAEFIDAVRACMAVESPPDTLKEVITTALWKVGS